MEYIKITFADLQPEQREILIAQLADAGYEGFEEKDSSLDAFINSKSFNTVILNEISFKYQTPYSKEKIAETNWNQVWESNFEPVIVNDYVAIRADFHKPITTTKFEIVITPKMSFGTGHHATTYMMIELMKELDLNGRSVLDFGSGTGILAILAEKEGAKNIDAIDNDDWSISNAGENFKKNNCSKINLRKASNAVSEIRFDIILANINKNVIVENLPVLSELLNKGGQILLSGLLNEDKDEILSIATELRLNLKKELIRNNWIALQFDN
ncbi:MAG TPA: 50S ribosomal protein L11 methyltransferase [Chitinophagaceae bacterium]|nr:50S ribosomal protein L11 methyltransferase [Chitinophagaceae bacterium]